MGLAGRLVACGLLVLGTGYPATAQDLSLSPPGVASVAFVNVNLIRMETERVEPGQTVIISGNRIAAIGVPADVQVPEGATVIDGSGRYLVPGLTDSHVHLATDMPWARTRPDFGDAPLYLAHGVTTVINLRGSSTQLEWRRRINQGELLGPTIYTSGEFINEPRVNTVDEVAREVTAQRAAGYDLVKFHEVWTPEAGFSTTTGLSLPAYLRMNDIAREIGIPLVGHAPVNLGLEALLSAKQPLAHVGTLSNIHFLPVATNRRWLLVTVAALFSLTIIVVASGIGAVVQRWRTARASRGRPRVIGLAALAWLAGLLAALSAVLVLPGGPLFDSVVLRLVFTSLVSLVAVASLIAAAMTVTVWRDPNASFAWRSQATLASIIGLTVAVAGLIFWVPLAWRSSDHGIEQLAAQLYDAGMPVQSTLIAYDAIGGPGRSRLVEDPTIDYLHSDTREIWRRVARGAGPPGYRYTEFMKKVIGKLHRAGVPVMAGTDAMGVALIAPGSSLHREIELLAESGLTPYEVMNAATVVPASFLGKEAEFGTVAVGKRADLLLIDGNPLEDVTRLRRPIGVMTRGHWFTRDQLQEMLTGLAQEQ